ncbi:cytochrome c [Sphingobium sp. AN641]|uniref:c-type cytochrome n=1 Tax=Sphingobium sp. AN641 TaxID=3133443 RepID=UPI0030BDD970
MKKLSFATFAVGILAATAATLTILAPPAHRKRPSPTAATAPAMRSVSADGFTLTSISVDLPIEDRPFPDGPQAAIVNARCTACHSASMVLTQPALSREQWKAIVIKMRDVYRAPIGDDDIPKIVDYLSAAKARASANAAG